jgi:type IV pilus assembly protein PilV
MRNLSMNGRDVSFRRRGRGFTLVEALVALLALSIGLLGVAGLQLSGLRNNLSAAWRSQATYLAYDVIDRIRANRNARTAYRVSFGAVPGAATGAPVAQNDLAAWKANLAAALPGGDGAVTVNGTDDTVVTVTIQWNDERGTATPLQFVTETRL